MANDDLDNIGVGNEDSCGFYLVKKKVNNEAKEAIMYHYNISLFAQTTKENDVSGKIVISIFET